MKVLVVLTGAPGAGKTTASSELGRRGAAVLLKPFTTRDRRDPAEDEYIFLVNPPAVGDAAWAIEHAGKHYGMLMSEIDRIPNGGVGVTVFEPLQLDQLEPFRAARQDFEVVIVGLDTIEDQHEQHARVGTDPRRRRNDIQLAQIRDRLRRTDVRLTGDEAQVAAALVAICRILTSRGGVLTSEALLPMLEAGSLLTRAEAAQMQSASYDLRIGDEIWCAGFKDLDVQNNIFQVPPYSFAIVKAMEQAWLPTFVTGQFDVKVSLFLSGVILSNGPQVDPGYKGDLFCMLFNGNSTPLTLRMGEHFCTIQFFTTSRIGQPYNGIYTIRDKLRQNMPVDVAIGQGGAIFSRMAAEIAAAKQEVIAKIPKERSALLVSLLVFAAGVPIAIALWGASVTIEASKAADAARTATREFKDLEARRGTASASNTTAGRTALRR